MGLESILGADKFAHLGAGGVVAYGLYKGIKHYQTKKLEPLQKIAEKAPKKDYLSKEFSKELSDVVATLKPDPKYSTVAGATALFVAKEAFDYVSYGAAVAGFALEAGLDFLFALTGIGIGLYIARKGLPFVKKSYKRIKSAYTSLKSAFGKVKSRLARKKNDSKGNRK